MRVLTHRDTAAVGSPIPSVDLLQLQPDDTSPADSIVTTPDGPVPLAPFLAGHDIVVNCTLQDPNAPITYLRTEDLGVFRPGSLIVDVSVDEGMGFSWAHGTTFAEPMVTVGESTNYYAVDHSPSLLWNSTTWEISEALMPFLRTVLPGVPRGRVGDDPRAVEIDEGHVVNDAVLAFQHRSPHFPHERQD